MKVYTNGFPKTGNHALVKACELLGIRDGVDVRHTNYADALHSAAEPISEFSHRILIKREPRNVVLSMIRFNGKPVTPGMFMAYFRKFIFASLPEEMKLFAPWMDDPKTLVIAYEDIIRDDQAMRRIAAHVGMPYVDGAWAELPSHTFTWNPDHSDYHSVWTPQVQRDWEREGGRALIEAWGYRWNS